MVTVERLEGRRLLSASQAPVLPPGSLDPTFGQAGAIAGHDNFIFADGQAHAMVVQPDGRIVIAGQSGDDEANLPPQSVNSHLALVRLNADGTLDPTFGTGGRVTQSLGQIDESINALALQPDGKLVAVGYTGGYGTGAASHFFVARFNPDGSLDQTFGHGGFTTTVFDASDSASALALEPDGRIVVVGSTSSASEFAIARYTPSGDLDPTFAAGGKLTQSFAANSALNMSVSAGAVVVQPDGRIIVGGGGPDSAALIRLTPSGRLDATFGTGGIALPPNDKLGGVLSLALTKNGSILAAGPVTSDTASTAIARFSPTGRLDHSFGKRGSFGMYLPEYDPQSRFPSDANFTGTTMAVSADGRIVLAGYVDGESRLINPSRFAVLRVTRNGQLDRSFSGQGWSEPNTDDLWPSLRNEASAVAVQKDGRVVVAGYGLSGSDQIGAPLPPDGFEAVRFTRGGALDPTFGKGGLLGPTAHGFEFGGQAVAARPGGGVVVASGYFYSLAAYTSDGSLDSSFGSSGRIVPEFQEELGIPDSVTALLPMSDGSLLVAGTGINSNSNGYTDAGPLGYNDIALERLRPNGSPDRSFGRRGLALFDLTIDKSSPDEPTVNAVTQQPDGKILAAVSTSTNLGFTVVRFNRNGSIDRSFGHRGVVRLDPMDGTQDVSNAILVDAQGRIVIGGTAQSPELSSQGKGFLLARLLPNGAIDPTFGSDGSVLTDFGGFANLSAIRLLNNTTLVAAGTTPSGFAVAHYTIDGRLDPSFGVAGEVTSAFQGTQAPNGTMLIASDGATYASDLGGILARYAPGGALDPTFASGGILTLPSSPRGLALDPDGNVLVAASDGNATTVLRVLG